jgi:hypothetical protein
MVITVAPTLTPAVGSFTIREHARVFIGVEYRYVRVVGFHP